LLVAVALAFPTDCAIPAKNWLKVWPLIPPLVVDVASEASFKAFPLELPELSTGASVAVVIFGFSLIVVAARVASELS
jgi:hypothetical protein